MENSIEFKVWGRYALFTDPSSKLGGEKFSYQIPTYEAMKGIVSSIYWKPTIVWYIDQIRVMKLIRTQTRNAKPIKFNEGKNDLSIYTYLQCVEYQVRAYFDWNYHRKDMEGDRNAKKHLCVAERMLERGGRRDIFLGTRECQAYVQPCKFLDGIGEYDNYPGELSFGLMFHGFDYPDEFGKNEFRARFWRPIMDKGVVKFKKPEECDPKLIKTLRTMTPKPPKSDGLKEEGLLEGCEEGSL